MSMQSEWLSFLSSQGAQISDDSIESFPSSVNVETDTLFIPLDNKCLYEISGDDAENFLQGQLSNDIRKVDDSHHQLSAYCSPKGRMLADFRIFSRNGSYMFIVNKDIAEQTMKRLRMYVLMSKVKIDESELIMCALSGPQAEALVQQQFNHCPGANDETVHVDDVSIIRITGTVSRFIVVAPLENMKSIWQAFAEKTKAATASQWRLLDILAGIPSVNPETVEAFVPQMANLQLIDGVNFKKGCYPGQEVVARMQYLGKLKRRMYLAHVNSDRLPQIGESLFSPDSRSGQGAGKIVDVQAANDGGYELLAVIEIATAENGNIHLFDVDGPKLEFKPLPYPVEEAS